MIPTLNGSALGWSDIHYTVVRFAIFENGHYAAVLVHFDECPNVFFKSLHPIPHILVFLFPTLRGSKVKFREHLYDVLYVYVVLLYHF